jgi:hypothetical protein
MTAALPVAMARQAAQQETPFAQFLARAGFTVVDPPPGLMTHFGDVVRDIFIQHGASAFKSTREVAIAHEVGHAIVGAHEGFEIRRIMITPRSAPNGELVWGGRYQPAGGTFRSGPDTSPDENLRRARLIIAGLAGEVATRTDVPGSSVDELAMSQLLACNAALKLADPGLNDAEREAYARQLFHKQVFCVAVNILCGNADLFNRLVEHLHQHEHARGDKLRRALAQVKRVSVS